MFLEYLGVSVLINLVMFLPAYKFRTDKLTDLSYAITFITLALILFLFNTYHLSKLLLLIMITLWGVRLGSFLFKRVSRAGKDSRFDKMRSNFWRFGSFWLIQGVTVFLVMTSSVLFFNEAVVDFNYLSVIGLIVWGSGLAIESIADNQKSRFKQDLKNKGKWIDTGLWKYSRHPNYFGEITHWVGVYLFTLNSINPLIGLISPAYITITILFISGLPILEKQADERWGKIKEYKDYKNRTSVLIPWFNH